MIRIVRKRPPQGGPLQMGVSVAAAVMAAMELESYQYGLPLCLLGGAAASLVVSIPWVFFRVQLVAEVETP